MRDWPPFPPMGLEVRSCFHVSTCLSSSAEVDRMGVNLTSSNFLKVHTPRSVYFFISNGPADFFPSGSAPLSD